MVTQIFGDILYYPETESIKEFPCPEELKNRVMISTKPPKEYLHVHKTSTVGGGFMRGFSLRRKDPSEQDRWGKEVTDLSILYEKLPDQSIKV